MKYAVFGASGRMGSQLAQVGLELGLTPVLGYYRKNKPVGYLCAQSFLETEESIDCFIDFSLPESFEQNVQWVFQKKKPLVSGVTGLGESDFQTLSKVSCSIPVLWSPNFSLGIALFKKLLGPCGSLSSHFQYHIEDVHHKHKKDSPSGTAKLLQKSLSQALPEGAVLPEIVSLRVGGVVGEHSLRLFGQYETVTITHSALDRKVFALGALEVAKWLVNQPPGLYTLDDYIESLDKR
jgi:4-hydroxy-tetrahydrodipicolinate reductase